MEFSDTLKTLYSATVEQQDGQYHIVVPAREVEKGNLEVDETHQVGLLSQPTETDAAADAEVDTKPESSTQQGPPVKSGDRRKVEIEGIGEQGDGVAKIDRGYVVIVPETELGDHVTVEIDQARENVGFATVVERHSESDDLSQQTP